MTGCMATSTQFFADFSRTYPALSKPVIKNTGFEKTFADYRNPGILGTLEMLLETSCKGAVVNLEDIPRNESVEWADWLRSYPGSGFVFTADEDCCEYIKEYLIHRESSISIAPTKIDQIVEATSTGQCKALILDFDKTLFNTSFGTEAREDKKWDKVYTYIPQFELYDGWREVLKWCKENNVKMVFNAA
mgnify:CR=1 FL=1